VDTVAVIVLTGGGSTRMGEHKPALDVGGRPIIARILDAVAGLPVVVVGDAAGVPAGVTVVREEPPGGGPVAGVAAGFRALTSRYGAPPAPSGAALERVVGADFEGIVLLAGDLPFVTRAAVEALVTALDTEPDADTALATDADGQVNWLCAAWRAGALRDRLAGIGEPAGSSMRRLYAGTHQVHVRDEAGWSVDVDTPADLDAARARASTAR
jgi:molybdopterin-guanine dinucleotide biosynthesis protein A